MIKKAAKLLFSILICLSAGLLGSAFTSASIPVWYASLNKPLFNPPNWVFGPVWTALYILMGVSLYVVWEKKMKSIKPFALFGLQLCLNALWSFLFFGVKNPLAALIEIIILWLSILFTMLSFYKISKKAAYLLVPYLIWVTFASVLNLFIVVLN